MSLLIRVDGLADIIMDVRETSVTGKNI